jgi:GNAT superfamily N-acetyltransferase
MLLRPAEPADALAVARVHIRAWQAGYRGILPDGYLDSLRAEDRAPHYDFSHTDPAKPCTIVAVDETPDQPGSRIVGFATTLPALDADLPHHGELRAFYVDPDYWRRGIGVALIAAARKHLFEIGFRKAYLWALVGNIRADRFYKNDGWLPDGRRRVEKVWNIEVDEVRYQRGLDA